MEHRAHLRIQPCRSLWVSYPGFIGQVHNFGIAGAYIRNLIPPSPGEKLPVTFWSETENRYYEVEAIVRHAHPMRGMGVEFVGINGTGVRFLCNYWDS